MKSVDILYGTYLDDDLNVTIGGIQTYISDLCNIITDIGASVRIVQFSNKGFEHKLNENITVCGYKIEEKNLYKRFKKLYDMSLKTQTEDTVTIFATDTMIPKNAKFDSIAIQHGIFWDIPRVTEHSVLRQVAAHSYIAFGNVRRALRVKNVVCVDYNYINWYRTQLDYVPNDLISIPNYTKIADKFEKPTDKISVIFARRLFDYRGTRVFTNAIKRILDEGYDINVTVAGSGPDENWMREQLDGYHGVSFIKYQSHESLDIHKDKHIAIVPTVGSEGTSLSLLEAMSAQCAVVCTNVGGMTNIVLDGHNGLMVSSGSVDQLYEAIKRLLDNESLRIKLSNNAYQSVIDSFSYEKWAEQWKKLLTKIIC